MAPLVTVITPTYNREAYLTEAIESLRAQDFTDWEMIVIDDGSTDSTRQCVEAFMGEDDRIHYLYQENAGASIARNHGISRARGEYLAFLDSDDRYQEGGLGALVEGLRSAPPQVKLVYGNFTIVDAEDEVLDIVTATPPMERPLLYFQFLISEGNPVVPSASLMVRQVLDEVGLFDTDYEPTEDLELWTRLVQSADFGKVDRQITLYRRHEGQVTKRHALRRLAKDRIAYKFFRELSLEEWFPNAKSDRELSLAMGQIAREMLRRQFPTVDTALYILRLAQTKFYLQEREEFIKTVEAEAGNLLEKKFGVVARFEPEDVVK